MWILTNQKECVENVADGGVEPKSAIIEAFDEASDDVKPTVNVKLKVKIPFHRPRVYGAENTKKNQ